MRSVRQKGTAPELIVAELLAEIGVGDFQTNDKNLPGAPDFVISCYKVALFVHGCFWHRHQGCKRTTTPKSNHEFWQKKFQQNVSRDEKVSDELEALGWQVEVVWECQTKDRESLRNRMRGVFGLG